MSKNIITLGATPDYVSNWGVWPMFRELAQNVTDKNGTVTWEQSVLDPNLYTATFRNPGVIRTQDLLYGSTTKANDPTTRGKHGDGLKNALIVALREGFKVAIVNGNELWEPLWHESEVFNTTVLGIEVTPLLPAKQDKEVIITVAGITAIDKEMCFDYFIPNTDRVNVVFGTEETGYAFETYLNQPSLFVGGLFVAELPKPTWEDASYAYSYNFPPNLVPLDRDRTAVDDTLIQELITDILITVDRIDIMLDLADSDSLDIRGYSHYATKSRHYYHDTEKTFSEVLAEKALASFYATHGDNAFPIQKHTRKKFRVYLEDQGLKPVEMSSAFFNITKSTMYRNIQKTKMPDINPLKFLESVLTSKKYALRGNARAMIEERIEFYKKYTEIETC